MHKVLVKTVAAFGVVLLWGAYQARAVDIVWVHQERGNDVPTWQDDQWRALLEDNGHTIIDHDFFDDLDLDPGGLDVLNSGDLVIFSRDSNSGDYNDGGQPEIDAWTEGVTKPMIVLTPYVLRSSRWLMVDSTSVIDAENPMEVLDPSHPIFNGVPLDGNNRVDVWDDTLLGPDDNIDLIDTLDVGNGTLLAQDDIESPWIIHWDEGVEFYDGSETFAGGPRLFLGAGSDDDPNSWGSKNLTPEGDQIFLNAVNFMAGVTEAPKLQAGDADQNLEFNQLDLVKVQIAAKYLSGQPATWGEGDWNGAPGGKQGSPPAGDGLFDQKDIIAALAAGKYLTGPYAALQPAGSGDRNASIVYNPGTGEVAVQAGATALTSINIDSAAGIFTGEPAQNLGGSFDNDADNNIFKATFGDSFGSLSFGNVAQAGLSEEFVRNDLSAVGSLLGGGDLGNVDLIYVPEPASIVLALLGLIGLTLLRRRRS